MNPAKYGYYKIKYISILFIILKNLILFLQNILKIFNWFFGSI